MANYPLKASNKEGMLLLPNNSSFSDEYAEKTCNLFLRSSVEQDGQGKLHKYYRLHAKQAHNTEMALAYAVNQLMDKHGTQLKTDALIHSDQGYEYTSSKFVKSCCLYLII